MAAGEGEHGEPLYLTFEDALEIFAAILGGTVAQAADQLRSRDALAGALGRPRAYAHYEDADLPRAERVRTERHRSRVRGLDHRLQPRRHPARDR